MYISTSNPNEHKLSSGFGNLYLKVDGVITDPDHTLAVPNVPAASQEGKSASVLEDVADLLRSTIATIDQGITKSVNDGTPRNADPLIHLRASIGLILASVGGAHE